MKKCPHCAEEVQKKARVCPHCQMDLKSWWRRHKILTVVLVFLGSGLVVSLLGGSGGSNKVISTDSPKFVKVLRKRPKTLSRA